MCPERRHVADGEVDLAVHEVEEPGRDPLRVRQLLDRQQLAELRVPLSPLQKVSGIPEVQLHVHIR